MSRRKRQPPRTSETIEIADRLHSAAVHLLRRLRAEDEASGLSAPRLSALSVVVFGGPITMSELAAAEQVRLPTISRLVTELERDGLVTRVRDENDRRVQRVRATARGKRLLQEGRERRIAKLAADLKRLPAAERRRLRDAAKILIDLSRPRREAGR